MPFARKEGLKIRIRHADIERRVRAVARRITKDFKGQRVHLIGVLKGACFFLADLAREIDLETSIDFIAVASYGKTKESSGQVRMLKDLDNNVAGLNVILVEDILDTGLTPSRIHRSSLSPTPINVFVDEIEQERAEPRTRARPVESERELDTGFEMARSVDEVTGGPDLAQPRLGDELARQRLAAALEAIRRRCLRGELLGIRGRTFGRERARLGCGFGCSAQREIGPRP